MEIEIVQASDVDGEVLAEMRIAAMRESLEAIDRFDPERARARFLNSFDPAVTFKIFLQREAIGFYVLREREDYLWLDHFYICPQSQSRGAGGRVVEIIKETARSSQKPIRLGALKESRANRFYRRHGFVEQERKEWDIYYEWAVDQA